MLFEFPGGAGGGSPPLIDIFIIHETMLHVAIVYLAISDLA
jgi:hypothetical protein